MGEPEAGDCMGSKARGTCAHAVSSVVYIISLIGHWQSSAVSTRRSQDDLGMKHCPGHPSSNRNQLTLPPKDLHQPGAGEIWQVHRPAVQHQRADLIGCADGGKL